MFEEIMEDTLPTALMLGVDYELFWELNPKSLSPFIKAFELKREVDDIKAWEQGLYIQMAIASCLDKDFKYPKRPKSGKLLVEDKESPRSIREKLLRNMDSINSRIRAE